MGRKIDLRIPCLKGPGFQKSTKIICVDLSALKCVNHLIGWLYSVQNHGF